MYDAVDTFRLFGYLYILCQLLTILDITRTRLNLKVGNSVSKCIRYQHFCFVGNVSDSLRYGQGCT
jgi:hypothetical protein